MRALLKVAVLFTVLAIANAVPPTCYSRVLTLSEEIMDSVKFLQRFKRTSPCVDVLPKLYLDVHNSCIMSKLRDHLYILQNLTPPKCRDFPRVTILKNKVRNLYTIMSKVCYRDVVYLSDDCDAMEHPPPTRPSEGRPIIES
ncbi:cytokine-like protein 1 [Latimeria chalumnae]|nr:PREDICTED: cytokine-like protein 1 [Latimeria chalumnae]|eukprot:XP_006009617.1 PREDICTED: cytokine-like protein 1 [Latimeria chalumnae]